MKWMATLGIIVAAAGCGGQTDTGSSGAGGSSTGGASGGTGGASGGAGGTGGATGGSGNVGGGTGAPCNPSGVMCDAMPPNCPPGQVPSVQGSCWGPCVPILSCTPEPNCDNCQSGFCVAYQSFTTEYRCVLPSLQCQALACSCLAQYFCVDPFSACTTQPGAQPPIACECPTC